MAKQYLLKSNLTDAANNLRKIGEVLDETEIPNLAVHLERQAVEEVKAVITEAPKAPVKTDESKK